MGDRRDAGSERAPWWKGSRGEGYVAVQVIIFGFIVIGPRSVPGLPVWADPYASAATILGVALIAAGTALTLWGVRALGTNLTALPYPTRALDAGYANATPRTPTTNAR